MGNSSGPFIDLSASKVSVGGKSESVKLPSQSSKSISFNIVGNRPTDQPLEAASIVRQSGSELPLFPRHKRPIFSRHRHDANPALALKVLQDIQTAVDAWHTELRQTIQHIQDLYMEGPIVDGWLEAVDGTGQQTSKAELDAALLRHADPQQLSTYVEQLCEALPSEGEPSSPQASPTQQLAQSPNYRLCSLDSDGQVQCLPCPAAQIYTVSLAIARNQKLRQLLDQKQYLEARLKRAVETLTSSRDSLGIQPISSHQEPLEA